MNYEPLKREFFKNINLNKNKVKLSVLLIDGAYEIFLYKNTDFVSFDDVVDIDFKATKRGVTRYPHIQQSYYNVDVKLIEKELERLYAKHILKIGVLMTKHLN